MKLLITNSKSKGVVMIKKFYVFAWFLLIASAMAAIFKGTFDAVAMIAVSLGIVGLVYAFGLWAVTRDVQPTG